MEKIELGLSVWRDIDSACNALAKRVKFRYLPGYIYKGPWALDYILPYYRSFHYDFRLLHDSVGSRVRNGPK